MTEDNIYTTTGDAGLTVVYDLRLNGVGPDLSSATVVCHMRNILSGAAITTATVTADADQVTFPGRVSTVFSASNLATSGAYTIEWQSTIGTQIITYPGDASDRPVMTIRKEVA